MNLHEMTLDQLSQLEADISAERARRAGEGLVFWTGRDGQILQEPSGGAILNVRWATEDDSYSEWYSSEYAALAALTEVAKSNGRFVSPGERRVDLTVHGCKESYAIVLM